MLCTVMLKRINIKSEPIWTPTEGQTTAPKPGEVGPRTWHVGICTQFDRRCPSQGGHHLEYMSALSDWPRNRLLLALPASNLKRIMPELEHIRCQREQVLMDADSPLDHVFFPDSGVVSVVAVYSDGSVIEMATIGREGCSDVQAVFGARRSSIRLLVQIPGDAAKMSRAAFARAMASMPAFRSLMFGYVQAFLEQVMVSVACNGAHSLRQRLARWLLMMRDRGDDDVLQITQNLLAEMLGVQRPSITNVARELEDAGLIARGLRQVTILDRRGLVQASCECYQLVRARVAFHLPKTYT
jgi:CRP-like cAMP-binding protein